MAIQAQPELLALLVLRGRMETPALLALLAQPELLALLVARVRLELRG